MRHNLYDIAHSIKEKLPFIWNIIEKFNEWLFLLRYGKRLKRNYVQSTPEGYEIRSIIDLPAEKIAEFFAHQPEEAFTYFRPHGFDEKSIMRLQRNKSFLGYLLIDKSNEKIAGYCFIRCFFNGQGYRGRMVDIDYRGKGLGTTMNNILKEIGFGIGLRLLATISKDNIASYHSAVSANKYRIIKEMPNNVLYLEILPDS